MISFGKYKGKPVEVFLKDTQYVNWCRQNGLLEKYNIEQTTEQSKPDDCTKTLYVLSLQQGKYYVGTTENFQNRLNDHKNGTGSEWTKRYPVISVYSKTEVSFRNASKDESVKTCELMLKFGINNVRGAEMCKPNDYTSNDLYMLTGIIGNNLHINYKIVSEQLKKELPVDRGYNRGYNRRGFNSHGFNRRGFNTIRVYNVNYDSQNNHYYEDDDDDDDDYDDDDNDDSD